MTSGTFAALYGSRHRIVVAAAGRVLFGLSPCQNEWPAVRHLRLRFASFASPLLDALEASPRPPVLRIRYALPTA